MTVGRSAGPAISASIPRVEPAMPQPVPIPEHRTRRIVFGAVGVLLLAAGLVATWTTIGFLGSTKVVVGTVVALRKTTRPPVHPVLSFTTEDGRTIEFRHPWSSNPPAYSIGEEVAVRYDPADPASARIGGVFSLWGLPLGLLALGTAFAFAAARWP